VAVPARIILAPVGSRGARAAVPVLAARNPLVIAAKTSAQRRPEGCPHRGPGHTEHGVRDAKHQQSHEAQGQQ